MEKKCCHEECLRQAIAVSKRAKEEGNMPFGAILVSDNGEVLMGQGNIEKRKTAA